MSWHLCSNWRNIGRFRWEIVLSALEPARFHSFLPAFNENSKLEQLLFAVIKRKSTQQLGSSVFFVYWILQRGFPFTSYQLPRGEALNPNSDIRKSLGVLGMEIKQTRKFWNREKSCSWIRIQAKCALTLTYTVPEAVMTEKFLGVSSKKLGTTFKVLLESLTW